MVTRVSNFFVGSLIFFYLFVKVIEDLRVDHARAYLVLAFSLLCHSKDVVICDLKAFTALDLILMIEGRIVNVSLLSTSSGALAVVFVIVDTSRAGLTKDRTHASLNVLHGRELTLIRAEDIDFLID